MRMSALTPLLLLVSGCISSAPIVPETSSNIDQISSCQTTAAAHNLVVISDFVLSGSGVTLATSGAAISDATAKTDLVIVSAIVGGLSLAGGAIAGYTASNFANSQCPNVVGPLPVPLATKPIASAQ